MNDGKEFEFEVRQLLQLMGFNAEVTGYSQDGGVDLLAFNPTPLTGGKCVVQCKAQRAPVGEPVLRDLFGTMYAQGANKGILITTSTFTAAALRFAQGKPLELIDGTKYRELCEQHGLTAHTLGDQTALDELRKSNSQHVRITSVDCTDPDQHKNYQKYVFHVGTLSIGQYLKFSALDGSGFGLPIDTITDVESEQNASSRDHNFVPSKLELKFIHFNERYRFRFEGCMELIGCLRADALARSRGDVPARNGCLNTIFLLLSLFLIYWLMQPR